MVNMCDIKVVDDSAVLPVFIFLVRVNNYFNICFYTFLDLFYILRLSNYIVSI
jgi:hypothetical protein